MRSQSFSARLVNRANHAFAMERTFLTEKDSSMFLMREERRISKFTGRKLTVPRRGWDFTLNYSDALSISPRVQRRRSLRL